MKAKVKRGKWHAGAGVAGHEVGDAGAAAVAEALNTNRSVTKLDLQYEDGGGMEAWRAAKPKAEKAYILHPLG